MTATLPGSSSSSKKPSEVIACSAPGTEGTEGMEGTKGEVDKLGDELERQRKLTWSLHAQPTSPMSILHMLFKKYGVLNDHWNAYHYYEKKAHAHDRTVAAERVEVAWERLKHFQRSASLPKRLERMMQELSATDSGQSC